MSTTLRRSVLLKYPNKIFVETGTHMGDGVAMALACGFEKIYSVELNPELVTRAEQIFAKQISDGQVEIWQGDTIEIFPKLINSIDAPATFWLDAHWDGGPMGKYKCPLPVELETIANHSIKTHSILIDDRRLFDVKGSNWGEGIVEAEILQLLHKINPQYEITFEDGFIPNDVIAAKINA